MQSSITFAVRRNVPANDDRGRPTKIALCLIQFPDRSVQTLAIPEGLLATVPPQAVDDFISQEVESAIGYEATRH